MTISVAFGDTYEPNDDLTTAFLLNLTEPMSLFIANEKDKRDLFNLMRSRRSNRRHLDH